MTENESHSTSPDTRSPMAKAIDLASQITSIGLTTVLPALGGHLLDRWLGTSVVFVVLGLAIGMTLAGLQLKRLVEKLERNEDLEN